MIDVILTGLTIVAVRYGRRLLVLGGMALARAFERADMEVDFEEEQERLRKWCTDPAYAALPCNASHHLYEEFTR